MFGFVEMRMQVSDNAGHGFVRKEMLKLWKVYDFVKVVIQGGWNYHEGIFAKRGLQKVHVKVGLQKVYVKVGFQKA